MRIHRRAAREVENRKIAELAEPRCHFQIVDDRWASAATDRIESSLTSLGEAAREATAIDAVECRSTVRKVDVSAGEGMGDAEAFKRTHDHLSGARRPCVG